METDLEILLVEGERRIDSRLIALGINVQHDNLMQTIHKYQSGLEKYGLILFETGVKSGPQRGKLPRYALLNKEQFGYLLMFVRITDQVREYREYVYDKFLEYERLKSASSQAAVSPRIHTFTDALRPRALENLNQVPEGYFSVMSELFKHLYNLEALLNQGIDNKAMLEISVGQLWSKYAREVLNIPDQLRHKYKHHGQSGRVVEAWAYPMLYANTFAKWLWSVYFPLHFPAYQQYRARRIARPAQKQLPSGKGA